MHLQAQTESGIRDGECVPCSWSNKANLPRSWPGFWESPVPRSIGGDGWHAIGVVCVPNRSSGRPRRMSDPQLRHLRILLRQGAVAHGWSNQWWTARRVAILIERHFGIQYHPEHVRKLLKQRLHWTSQKPQKHARERNDQEVERWIAEEWPRVLQQAVQRHAHIALLDESGFLLAPLVRRTLAPRGETPILDCSDSHDRISVISAITVSPLALRVGLHFMLLGDNENFHGEEVVLFLRQLKGEVGGPWTIVWDRNRIHSPSRVVRALVGQAPGSRGRGLSRPCSRHQPG